ncbi:hypothetical protein K438DRAFT_773717 [Mycena galopus ATCC 62051]|nr:hypothetical protein K438DRAFT_773717 [Mycena galopus ATCC 62051]
MVPFYEEHCAENDSESEEFTLRWFFAHEVSGVLLVIPFLVVLLFYAYMTATLKLILVGINTKAMHLNSFLSIGLGIGLSTVAFCMVALTFCLALWILSSSWVLPELRRLLILRFFRHLLSAWSLSRPIDFGGLALVSLYLGLMLIKLASFQGVYTRLVALGLRECLF